MAQDTIIVTGIEQYQEALRKMQTDNPRIRKELQAIMTAVDINSVVNSLAKGSFTLKGTGPLV